MFYLLLSARLDGLCLATMDYLLWQDFLKCRYYLQNSSYFKLDLSLVQVQASLVFRNLMQRMGHHPYIFLFLLIIYFSVVPFCQFYYTLFCLSWIEKFGQICSDYSMDSILSHSRKCLHLFNSLQKGLGYSNP